MSESTENSRIAKLERAVRAALKLRQAIEKTDLPVAQLLVPVSAVKDFDTVIEELKK